MVLQWIQYRSFWRFRASLEIGDVIKEVHTVPVIFEIYSSEQMLENDLISCKPPDDNLDSTLLLIIRIVGDVNLQNRTRYVKMSQLMRLCHFSSSVNSFFKRTCAAIQRG